MAPIDPSGTWTAGAGLRWVSISNSYKIVARRRGRCIARLRQQRARHEHVPLSCEGINKLVRRQAHKKNWLCGVPADVGGGGQ